MMHQKQTKPNQARQIFDYRGVVHHEYLSLGKTVNKVYFLSVMERLRDAMNRKHASPKARIVQDYFTKHSVNAIQHTAYSPDFAHFCIFFSFF